ncbi:MAG: hypothetical protein H8E34_07610 [Bacteroidetes bacterium]|nr:hypothetical protein [Bacteroidota bacterium]MBL6943535.1 hypothetical protein [Bacteroidales bacterium]
MKDFNNKFLKIFFVLLVLLYGCSESHFFKQDMVNAEALTSSDEQKNNIAVAKPPFSEDIFPCSECHAEQETNPERRLLDMHEEIVDSFHHDSENRWCLDCHDADNRDFLRLASGSLLKFEESYKLCGQCHGDKLRDWKVGVHGKRTGDWNGNKQYLLCVHCHNPHSPKFESLQPLPPPVRQEDIY